MSTYDLNLKRQKEQFAKALGELTPARQEELRFAFAEMQRSEEPIQPMMRQLHFGGEYHFDYNRNQVELHGEFSKQDLFRIALAMN